MAYPTFPTTRLRRMRSDSFSRNISQECRINVNDLIYPMFIIEGQGKTENINSMPGIHRLSVDMLVEEVSEIVSLKIPAVMLFPKISDDKKSLDASESYNPSGLIQNAVTALKKQYPKLGVITDVALDPYTTHGQDGIMDANNYIDNDITIEVLAKQALSHAKAGADIVAPSDMMDGRVQKIRNCFEANGYFNTKILAHSAKYASSLYSPFREAVGSINNLGGADKTTYQMDPANRKEALREVTADINEGADMVMIKPALPYLDVIYETSSKFDIPVLSYQVSAEYSMITAAAQNNWLDEKAVALETLLSIKRAGASSIISYFTKKAALWLNE